MALDRELFKEIAPEYASKPLSEFNRIVEEAEKQVTPGKWRTKTALGVALLTAHMLKMGERNGRVGGLTGQTVGSLSRSFGGVSATEALDLTSYGIEFKRVRRQIATSPLVV